MIVPIFTCALAEISPLFSNFCFLSPFFPPLLLGDNGVRVIRSNGLRKVDDREICGVITFYFLVSI